MKRGAAILLLLLTCLLTACGGDAPAAAAAPTAAPAPTATPAPTEAPTPAPTPTPTEAPAPTDAPVPTEKPDWASLGGTEYNGKAKGYGGYVRVVVVLDAEGNILDVSMGKHSESSGYGDKAIAVIPELIVESQSLDVDAVTGSTLTSEAIIAAVAAALTEAGLDPADYGYAP